MVFLLIRNPKNTFLILEVFECPGDSPGLNPIQDAPPGAEKPNKEVQEGKDQENAQSEEDSHSKNRSGKNKLTIRYLYHENISLSE